MLHEEMLEQLKMMIVTQLDFNLQGKTIDVDAPLFEGGLGLDSLALVDLIALIETNYDLQFGEEDLNMTTFANLRSLTKTVAALSERTAVLA